MRARTGLDSRNARRFASAALPLLVAALALTAVAVRLEPFPGLVLGALALYAASFIATAIIALGPSRSGLRRAIAAVAIALAAGSVLIVPTAVRADFAPFGFLALPVVALAAHATDSRRWLARSCVLCFAVVGLVGLGALQGFSARLGHSSPHVDALSRIILICAADSRGSAAALCFELPAVAVALAGALRGPRALRALFAAGAAGVLLLCVRHAFDLHLAESLLVAVQAQAPATELRGLENIGVAARACEGAIGVLAGLTAATALLLCVRESAGARRALRMCLPLPFAAALLATTNVYAGSWRMIDEASPPVWRTAGFEPVTRDAAPGFAFVPQSTWVLDAGGDRTAQQIGPYSDVHVFADRRAPLARLAAYARARPDGRISVARRPATGQALDASPAARARFPLLEILSRSTGWMSFRVGSADTVADRIAEIARLGRLCRDDASWVEPTPVEACTGWHVLVLHAIPSDATARELERDIDEVLVLDHAGDPREEPAEASEIVPRDPPVLHSPFGLAALVTFLVVVALAIARARVRWTVRLPLGASLATDPRPLGAPSPAWLARSACDARVVTAETTTYRSGAGPGPALVTARSFARALVVSVLGLVRACWLPLVVALALAVGAAWVG